MITKVQPISVSVPQAPSPKEIDRLGELKRRSALMAPDLAEEKAIHEKASKYAESLPADKPCTMRGLEYELQLGARRRERVVVAKWRVFLWLRKSLGLKALIGALTVPLNVIDDNIPKSAQVGMVSEEQSGWRQMSLVALHPAAKAELQEAA